MVAAGGARRRPRSMASTPASASSRPPGSRRPRSRSCSAASCSRTCAGSGRRCPIRWSAWCWRSRPRASPRAIPASRGATIELLLTLLEPRRAAGDPGQGLGRRVGRSRAARPSRRLPDRPRRDPPSRDGQAGRRGPGAIGAAPLRLGAKEGLALLNGTQVSTALALVGWFRAAAVFEAALLAGAMSVDAALGSDVPFDPRLNRVRGQPGQIRVAERSRGLLAGSAIRASHLVDCERVQDPYSLRCQPQVMGACLDLLRRGRRHAGARGARRLRQPAGVRPDRAGRGRRDPLGRQFPRPSRSPSPPTRSRWHWPRSARSPSAGSRC